MDMKYIPVSGVYPTMVTLYKDNGEINLESTEKLVNWYIQNKCQGIFAACQSSEIFYLTLEEKLQLVKTVLSAADKKLAVIASGHTSYTLRDQVYELNKIADTGIDALILISNRMDINNLGDDNWIRETENLIKQLPDNLPLGVYECPYPYKRLMSEKMLEWCRDTGRFYFMKDTCCDADVIAKRCQILSGGDMKLYNANAQTLLDSLKSGGSGYCGVMGNFHPNMYVRLCEIFDTQPKEAEELQALLAICAFIETLDYPICAKYHLKEFAGIETALTSRAIPNRQLSEYIRSCVRQMNTLVTN
jgi:Dihydrodipicolinate synthase/N-acetylneuraminate lyase